MVILIYQYLTKCRQAVKKLPPLSFQTTRETMPMGLLKKRYRLAGKHLLSHQLSNLQKQWRRARQQQKNLQISRKIFLKKSNLAFCTGALNPKKKKKSSIA